MKKGTLVMEILKEVKTMDIVIDNPVEPKEFFVTGKMLYVWSGFTDRIVPKATKVEKGVRSIESLDLVTDATDIQIELSLGNKNIFSESEAAALIAEMITRQSKGEDGDLLTNGYRNLFYTPECVVSVYWSGGGWGVSAWGRGGLGWCAGCRVFSPQLTLDA